MQNDLPEGLRVSHEPNGQFLNIDVPSCSATVALQGATVAKWAPTGHRPVLFTPVRPTAPGKALRGGIPVCAPWFGPAPIGKTAPQAHGYVRTVNWDLVSAKRVGDEAEAVFELEASEIPPSLLAPDLPADLRFRLIAWFGAALAVRLEITSPTTPCTVASALHTYLAVDDVRDVTISGLAGVDYFDKVADRHATQAGSVLFTSETDRVYATTTPVRVRDRDRVLEISHLGANVVVWNPWEVKGDQLADLESGEWQRFVCVEAGNVMTNSVALPAGGTTSITQEIRCLTTR